MAARAGRAVRLNNHFEARRGLRSLGARNWLSALDVANLGLNLRDTSLYVFERAHIVTGLLFVQLVAL